MSDVVHLELVTPEKLHASVEASLVEVPGTEGDFGVLPGHAPLISTIRPGVITVHAAGGDQRFFVMGGVAEVTPDRCTVLAEHLEEVSHMSADQAQIRLTNAHKAVDKAVTEQEKHEAAKSLAHAEALAAALH